MKRLLSVALAAMIVISVVVCSLSVGMAATGVTLSYTFSGSNANTAGYAQGTISLTVNDSAASGKYYLYWADDNTALSGYKEITTLDVSSGTKTFTMPERTAIPPDASKLIAIKSSSAPTNKSVSVAAGVYSIAQSKRLSTTKLYSFEALSDIHMCEGGSSSYPYDEQHLAEAFKTAADRNVDFIITSGDHVNNQRDGSNTNPYYKAEWNRYLKILADSDYVNPIYEAIGNHELWNGDTESDYKKDTTVGTKYFIKSTGLDSQQSTINAGKAYYEITEPVTGDHFLFVALEGGFYTDRVNEFSDAQISWLESKLKQYQNSGKNVFIIQHCNFYKWGSGDQLSNPLYDIPLKDSMPATVKLKGLLTTYKNAIMINGHTHFRFEENLNYSDNNGTSAVIMHNSSVGGTRSIVNGSRSNDGGVRDMTQGYIVEVYDKATIFNGTNLYYNEILPVNSYIISTTTSSQLPSQEPTSEPTQVSTQAPTQASTQAPTQQPTETTAPTETLKVINYGDVDGNGKIEILDATVIQRWLARLITLDDDQQQVACVSGALSPTIVDATIIQRYLAKIIKDFPVNQGYVAVASAKDNIAVTGAADVAALKTTVKGELSKNYLFASYNQYQALKKYVYELDKSGDVSQTAYDKLSTLYQDLLDLIEANGGQVGANIDVYFTNIPNWSTVNAYIWGGTGGEKAKWPGTAMTFVETNNMGQKVYKITIPSNTYANIIFNNGSTQTLDLALSNINNEGFYTTSMSGGKYLCNTYVYGE